MTKQNIFIINFDSLYEILDEIKDNLSFDIVKFKNIEDFLNTVNSNPNNLLIALKLNEKSLLNKGVNNKNILCFDDLPLSINKVIEFINLQLTDYCHYTNMKTFTSIFIGTNFVD